MKETEVQLKIRLQSQYKRLVDSCSLDQSYVIVGIKLIVGLKIFKKNESILCGE